MRKNASENIDEDAANVIPSCSCHNDISNENGEHHQDIHNDDGDCDNALIMYVKKQMYTYKMEFM